MIMRGLRAFRWLTGLWHSSRYGFGLRFAPGNALPDPPADYSGLPACVISARDSIEAQGLLTRFGPRLLESGSA